MDLTSDLDEVKDKMAAIQPLVTNWYHHVHTLRGYSRLSTSIFKSSTRAISLKENHAKSYTQTVYKHGQWTLFTNPSTELQVRFLIITNCLYWWFWFSQSTGQLQLRFVITRDLELVLFSQHFFCFWSDSYPLVPWNIQCTFWTKSIRLGGM